MYMVFFFWCLVNGFFFGEEYVLVGVVKFNEDVFRRVVFLIYLW